MRTVCPSCSAIVDVDDSYIGSTTFCPHCSNEFYVKVRQRKTHPISSVNVGQQKNDCHEGLCFVLGMMFPVLGLLVGALSGKERGFMFALYGNIIDGVISLICWFVFGVMLVAP